MNARVKAYAKLNLTLGVSGTQGGFHMLDSLVCSVDLYDLIVLGKRKDRLVTVEMHGRGTELLPHGDNNAAKAAEAYINYFGTSGADIKVYKNIPVGAGMGGSSADAAGVLRGMTKLYGRGSEEELKSLADSLGSDTGYMLTGGFARLHGRGDVFENINTRTKLNFLALVPRTGVSTAECYRRYDSSPLPPRTSDEAVKALTDGDLMSLGKNLFNALYPAAASLNQSVAAAYAELENFSPLGVCMTGSGSAVFALFETPELCGWAKSRYRGKAEAIQLKSVIL